MAKKYCVRFKNPNGVTIREGVVISSSPRNAIGTFCEQNNHGVMSVVKYSSWLELQNAFLKQGGSCVPCEVFQVYGERKNFYLLYPM